jgi:zinc protease
MKRTIFLAALFFIAMTACPRQSGKIEYRLPNGLKVIIFPMQKGENVSLVTLYAIGETSDPESKSGMAHLIEHLYATAAAGDFPSRTMDQIMTDYPKGWNAQTGMDYTVFAAVFPAKRLDEEIRIAAARMHNLDIKEADLVREIPRVEQELANMYGWIPMLASQNLSAGMLLSPTPTGRKGGVREQIKTMTAHALRARAAAYYKPANALIVISGPVKPLATKELIAKWFSEISSGQAIEARAVFTSPTREKLQITEITPLFPQAEPHVAISYRAPAAPDRLFPAFLVLVRRLQANVERLDLSPSTFLVIYAPLDRPEVVTLNLPAINQEDPEALLARLGTYVDEIRNMTLDYPELKATGQYYNFLFCRESYPMEALARDPYGVAFTLGRKKQLGINGDAIIKKIETVTQEELKEAAEIFAPEKSAAVIVKIK